MSNDIKTLADAQPGGRVRLGDQTERARFEAWVKNHVSSLRRATDGEYASNFTHALWSAWQAALSAQTSPGGQDHRMLELARRNIRAYIQIVSFPTEADRSTAGLCVDVLEEALAARQPSKQLDSVALGEATEFCIEKGDRKPVGEQRAALWIQFAENGNIRFWTKDQDRALAESFLHARPLTAFYASPQQPAQAVDLSDFKALYRAYVRLLESGRDRIRDLGGTCDPVDVMEANDVDLQAARRVLDSQAVGNG